MAKITNIKATPAPLDLVSSAPQSTPLKELEAIATRFVEIIRKRSAQRGEKVAITVPEILMGEGERGGQVMVCSESGRRLQTHRVFSSGRSNQDGKVWTIQISPFIAQDADACIRELLRSVAVGAQMAAKGRDKMTNYTRRGSVYMDCMYLLGAEMAHKSQDFKGSRGGAIGFLISASMWKKFDKAVDRYASHSINGEEVKAAPEAKALKPNLCLTAQFETQEQLDAVLAFLGVDSKSKAKLQLGKVLASLASEEAVAPLSIAN